MVIVLNQDGRRVIAALDGFSVWGKLVETMVVLTQGPIAPYLLAVKLNDALDRWGAAAFPRLWEDAGVGQDVRAMADMKVSVGAMADLKLRDVDFTNLNRIAPYAAFQADAIVTVAMDCSIATWQKIPEKYPELQTALMGVPTDISLKECLARFGGNPWEITDRQLDYICRQPDDETQKPRAPQPPCVIAGYDVIKPVLEKYPGIRPITPGIRDAWMDKGSQKRTAGVYDALMAGAYAVVMGTQIIKGYVNKDDQSQSVSPEESQFCTAAEIERYLRDTS